MSLPFPAPIRILAAAAMAWSVSGCIPVRPTKAPIMVGIEPVVENNPLRDNLSARLLFDLSSLPNVQVVDLGAPRNAYAFDNLAVTKVRLISTMLPGQFCLWSQYNVFTSGQIQYSSGMVIPRSQAIDDKACIDLYATRLYWDFLRQGL